MNLDNLAEITMLSERREEALKLTRAISEGSLEDFAVCIDGRLRHLVPFLNEKFIRAAISYAAEMELDLAEDRLERLGVSMPKRDRTPPTVEMAMSQLKMFQNAWIRSLGGSIRNKRHLIDALCVTTEEMRDRAAKYSSEPTVPKAEHDARVTELLEFNNELEQRARDAKRKLRTFVEGTSADKLVLAVEQAAANVISDIRTSQFL